MNTLHVATTATAPSVVGNLNANQLTSGTIDDSRLEGAYQAGNLTVQSANAAWIRGNLDTSRVVEGNIDIRRWTLDPVASNVVATDARSLGTSGSAYSAAYVDRVSVDDMVVNDVLSKGGVTMDFDLERTTKNVIPVDANVRLGSADRPWAVRAANIALHTLQFSGNLLDTDGNVISFSLINATSSVFPKQEGSIGREDRPWSALTTDTTSAQTIGVTDTVHTAIVPSGPAYDLGTSSSPWTTLVASNLEAQIDGNTVGDFVVVVDSVDGDYVLDVDDILLPSGPDAIRFVDDETTGLSLGNTLDLHGLTISANALHSNATIVTQHPTATLGSPTSTWRDAFANIHVPWGTSALDVTDAQAGSLTTDDLTVDTLTVPSIPGTVSASQFTTGTVDPARLLNQSVGLANVTTGNLVGTGGVTLPTDLVPAANVAYDLGSPTHRFRDLWVSGSSIRLGTATLSEVNGNVTIDANVVVTSGISGSGIGPAPLSITSVSVTDVDGNVLDDTAVSSTDGGHIQLVGVGFAPSSIVQVGGTNATSTTYISSTLLRASVGARSNGSYDVRVIRPDSTIATLPSSLTFSDAATWVTNTQLGNIYFANAFTIPLVATSDSNVTYSNVTALPVQMSLDPSGNLVGNITSVTTDTVYSLDLVATDEELQDASKTFLANYKALNVSNVVVTDNTWTTVPDLAVDTAGGYIQLSGSYFLNGDTVTVGGTTASTTYVSPTTLRAVV
ncbi:MAG: IPT/TIG domain-containing protein, partial [Ilumatobacteraceae bacterium]